MVYTGNMVAVGNQVSVLAADNEETKATAARLAAQADATSDFGATVRELFNEVAMGERLVVLRPEQEVTPAGAADLLGVSRQFIDRLLAEGVLPFRRLPDSRHRRIKVGDVVALAEERERRRKGAAAIRSALGGRPA